MVENIFNSRYTKLYPGINPLKVAFAEDKKKDRKCALYNPNRFPEIDELKKRFYEILGY